MGGERKRGLCPTKDDLELGLNVYIQFFICNLNAKKPTSEKKAQKKKKKKSSKQTKNQGRGFKANTKG